MSDPLGNGAARDDRDREPREEVLEHALHLVLAPADEQRAADDERVARILRAWERGERGSALPEAVWTDDVQAQGAADLVAERPPADDGPAPAAAWRRRVRWPAAAAAVLVAAGGSWLALRDPGSGAGPAGDPGGAAPRPVLARVASGPGTVVAARGDGATVSPGDLTWVRDGSEAEFQLAGGAAVRATGPAALGWRASARGVAVDLLAGRVELAGASAPVELHTDFGRVRAAAGTSLVAAVTPDDALQGWAPARPRAEREHAAPVARAPASQLLRLEVRAGEAELASARGIDRVGAGGVRWLASDPGTLDSVSRADERRLLGLLADLAEPGVEYGIGGGLAPKDLEQRWATLMELEALLAARPDRWDVLADPIRERFAEAGSAEDRPAGEASGWVLDLLALDRSRASLRLARELWRTTPGSFSLDHVLALAGRGAFEFERELYAIALSGAEPDPERRFTAACQIAFDGDPIVGDLLRSALYELRAAGDDRGEPALSRRLVLAAALDSIGDGQPLREERARQIERCRRWLGTGQVVRGREGTLALAFLDHFTAGPSPNLAFAARAFERFAWGRRTELDGEDDLSALLDALEDAGR